MEDGRRKSEKEEGRRKKTYTVSFIAIRTLRLIRSICFIKSSHKTSKIDSALAINELARSNQLYCRVGGNQTISATVARSNVKRGEVFCKIEPICN
jgi:hypothetical protein